MRVLGRHDAKDLTLRRVFHLSDGRFGGFAQDFTDLEAPLGARDDLKPCASGSSPFDV